MESPILQVEWFPTSVLKVNNSVKGFLIVTIRNNSYDLLESSIFEMTKQQNDNDEARVQLAIFMKRRQKHYHSIFCTVVYI